jgi:ABC-type transport system involved in multi-copper enzyme maturation permease subunit
MYPFIGPFVLQVVVYIAILSAIQGWSGGAGKFAVFASLAVLLQLGLVAMNETIGAYFSNLFVALAVSALASVLAILFNGVICSYQNMPTYLRWL